MGDNNDERFRTCPRPLQFVVIAKRIFNDEILKPHPTAGISAEQENSEMVSNFPQSANRRDFPSTKKRPPPIKVTVVLNNNRSATGGLSASAIHPASNKITSRRSSSSCSATACRPFRLRRFDPDAVSPGTSHSWLCSPKSIPWRTHRLGFP